MQARLWSSGDSFSFEKYPTTCAPFLSTFMYIYIYVYMYIYIYVYIYICIYIYIYTTYIYIKKVGVGGFGFRAATAFPWKKSLKLAPFLVHLKK
jgi:hypothetical protein